MRFLLAVMLAVLSISVSGMAQATKPLKVKPSTETKAAPKSTVPVKANAAGTNAAATSKELRNVERQTPKASGSAHAAKKAPRMAAVKPAKDKPNPPINFGGKGGAAGGKGSTKQPNPYKGRLKQKGAGRNQQ